MRFLITGGAGLIGSHLAELLLGRGHKVAVIDDLSTGSIRNIAQLKENKDFTYVIDSVLERRLLAELIDDADAIFHLAAAVGVKLIVESPVHTIETNVAGTEVVLSLAAKKKKPVLVASSSEVYGKSAQVPFRESGDLLLGPTLKARWSYACSKAIDEFLALAYFKEKGLPTVVARLFNTVGPRQTGRYGMVIPTFVSQALANEPITVYGDGSQSRCFCHVADTAEALAGLLVERKAWGGVFNVGSRQEVSIAELAEKVRIMVGTESSIVYVPYDEAYEQGFEDMQRRIPDISKIHELLGWAPKRDLETILQDVIAHKRKAAH
jgi:UDP-glucose 4-epimerase